MEKDKAVVIGFIKCFRGSNGIHEWEGGRFLINTAFIHAFRVVDGLDVPFEIGLKTVLPRKGVK